MKSAKPAAPKTWKDTASDLLWEAFYQKDEGARAVLLDLLMEKGGKPYAWARKIIADPRFFAMSSSSLAFRKLVRKLGGKPNPPRGTYSTLSRKPVKKVILVRPSSNGHWRGQWIEVERRVGGDFAWRERPWMVSIGSGYSTWFVLVFARDESEALDYAGDIAPNLVYDEVEPGDADEDEAFYVESVPWPSKLARWTDQLGVDRVREVRTARVTGDREGVFADGTPVQWVR